METVNSIEKKNLPCYCPINLPKTDNPKICAYCLGDILETKEISKVKKKK